MEMPFTEAEFEAFKAATAASVDGPHRSTCCGHCVRIADVRRALVRDAPTLDRMVALRRDHARYLGQEGVPVS